MRKIIQISTVSARPDLEDKAAHFLYALCDDGSVWFTAPPEAEWYPVEPIPGDDLANWFGDGDTPPT